MSVLTSRDDTAGDVGDPNSRRIGFVHPIERLRFVARANGVEDSLLAVEATAALMAFAEQPPALVAGCRRVLARQMLCGPLWWACARLLTAQDVWAVAQDTITELEDDPTTAALAYALDGVDPSDGADGDSDSADLPARPRLFRARAIGRSQVVAEPIGDGPDAAWPDATRPDAAWPDATRRGETSRSPATDGARPAWLVTPVGVHLSDPMWDALRENLERSDPDSGVEFSDLSRYSHFVGPFGLLPMVALDAPDCPVAAELFRLEG